MVTKEALERLRAERSVMNKQLEYTIGGAIETQVHSCVESDRIGQLNAGDRKLQQALYDMRKNQAFSFREGLARSQFNVANTVKP